jgi:hypothetical protein
MSIELLITIFVYYILPTVLCIFLGAKHNRAVECEEIPLGACFIPIINIIIILILYIMVFFEGELFQKFKKWFQEFKKWYRGY